MLEKNKMSFADNTVSLPVILYHRLLPEGHRDIGNSAITFSRFEADLKYIKAMNYHAVSFQEVIDYVKNDGVLPENPLVIAFDDGYYNNYLHAMPLLQTYGMKASLAVICARINEADKQFIGDENFGYCTWHMIQEMQDSSVFEITLHTYAMHVQKPRLGMTRMEGESEDEYCKALSEDIAKGKKKLKEKVNIDSRILMYPYGRTIDCAAIDVLSEHGIDLTAIVASEGTNILKKGDTGRLYNMVRLNRGYGMSSKEFFQPIFEKQDGV